MFKVQVIFGKAVLGHLYRNKLSLKVGLYKTESAAKKAAKLYTQNNATHTCVVLKATGS